MSSETDCIQSNMNSSITRQWCDRRKISTLTTTSDMALVTVMGWPWTLSWCQRTRHPICSQIDSTIFSVIWTTRPIKVIVRITRTDIYDTISILPVRNIIYVRYFSIDLINIYMGRNACTIYYESIKWWCEYLLHIFSQLWSGLRKIYWILVMLRLIFFFWLEQK